MTGQQEMFPRHIGYGGKKAAEIVGISYRQLDYWARTDLVRPSLADASGSGSRRKYSYQDLLELKVIKSLLDAGIRLELVRDVFTYLRDQLGEEMIDLVRKGQGVLNILPLSGVVEQVDASIHQLFPEDPAADAVEEPPGAVEVAAEP